MRTIRRLICRTTAARAGRVRFKASLLGNYYGENQHIVPHKGNWSIKAEGNQLVTKIITAQAEVIEIAEKIDCNQQLDTKIHGSK